MGGKSFVFFRTPRPDAVDPTTGKRYDDVIVIWGPVGGREAGAGAGPGLALLHHAHFEGHLSVLVRASRIDELSRQELAEII